MNLALCFIARLLVQVKGPSSSYTLKTLQVQPFLKETRHSYLPHYIVLSFPRLSNSGAVVKSVAMIFILQLPRC